MTLYAPKFLLSSVECELLLAFERSSSLPALALQLRKDASALSRQLQRIAAESPVIEKVGGRWRLTDLGRELNRWTLESQMQQQATLSRRRVVRIGGNRTFNSSALCWHVDALKARIGMDAILSIVTVDGGMEASLLSGEVDVGFACGKPSDPAVAYKRGPIESYVAAASPAFCGKYRLDRPGAAVKDAPYLRFTSRNFSDPFGELTGPVDQVYAVFNDILCSIECARQGLGWGVYPLYAIDEDLKRGTLRLIPGISSHERFFSVWWLRERKSSAQYVKACQDFLGEIRFELKD